MSLVAHCQCSLNLQGLQLMPVVNNPDGGRCEAEDMAASRAAQRLLVSEFSTQGGQATDRRTDVYSWQIQASAKQHKPKASVCEYRLVQLTSNEHHLDCGGHAQRV